LSEVKVFKNPYRRWTHFSTSSSTGEHVIFVIAKTGGFIGKNKTHRNRKSARFRRTTICNGVNYATTPNGDVMRSSNSGRTPMIRCPEDALKGEIDFYTDTRMLCDYPIPAERPMIRCAEDALKGRNMVAQGNALGSRFGQFAKPRRGEIDNPHDPVPPALPNIVVHLYRAPIGLDWCGGQDSQGNALGA